MMKFFRKYNKMLLAIGTALLMIVFVGGSALQGMLTPDLRNTVIANTSKLGPITGADRNIAGQATTLLGTIGLNWRAPMPGMFEPLELIDWVMLTREAETLGMPPSAAAAKAWLDATGRGPAAIEEAARRMRKQPGQIYAAAAEFLAVQQVAKSVVSAAIPSEAELRRLARAGLDRVWVRLVRLPGRGFEPEDPTFSNDELEAQFQRYRDVTRGRGLEFGYFRPPSIRVQYVKVDHDAVAGALRRSDAFLEREARKYYDANLTTDPRFRRPDTPDDQKPEVGPEELKPPQLTWEEARDAAIDVVRQRQAETAVARIVDWLIEQAAEAWFDIEPRDDGYMTPPSDVATLNYYNDLIARVPAQTAYPNAVSVVVTDYFSADDVFNVPDIGSYDLKRLAFQVEGLATIPENERGSRGSYLSPYETSAARITDRNGNVYVFRVVDVRDAHAPDTIDEVRDEVINDLKVLHGFEAARSAAEALTEAAIATGNLKEAFDADEALADLKNTEAGAGIAFYEPTGFPRVDKQFVGYTTAAQRTSVPGVGVIDRNIVDGFFALADADDPVGVFEARQDGFVLVVEWLETLPGTDAEYAELRKTLAPQLQQIRVQSAVRDWMTPAKIRTRNGFELVRR